MCVCVCVPLNAETLRLLGIVVFRVQCKCAGSATMLPTSGYGFRPGSWLRLVRRSTQAGPPPHHTPKETPTKRIRTTAQGSIYVLDVLVRMLVLRREWLYDEVDGFMLASLISIVLLPYQDPPCTLTKFYGPQ